ncbi:class I SAM-dependent methyltransferase [Bacillus tianshenii]|uniref:class I SAM-dependent methyltransferase n=1 Tax=Sutcliffiella tianshenii TaxID=1463404 RepID=UPI001CD5B3F6|nr:class I SAM-dependent methyltransferase [Bacillus tianshenii]MCA1320622.1 class I SAM-dependent methyltransferase [Bacillus tianshenii]
MINKNSWEEAAARFYGRNPLPEYGPLAPSEDELNLFGEVEGSAVLDIGCGSGHSLLYMSERRVKELWGLDLSKNQIYAAEKLLEDCKAPVRLFESPMEANPGLPEGYFDLVYSIFAIGWTTDLSKTVENVFRYLKSGGRFIFSWEHPLHSRVRLKEGALIMDQAYHKEGPYDHEAWENTAMMQQSKVSTYINTLIDQGFHIERIVEDVRLSEKDRERHSNRWYSYEKATMVPTTLIIKCRKP